MIKLILKTIRAGPLVQQVLYDNIRLSPDDNYRELAAKAEIRRQTDYWIKVKHHALAALICNNFDSGSLFVTLDYSPDKLPADRSVVMSNYNYAMTKLRRRCPDRQIKAIRCTEHRHGVGRWHLHAVIDGATTEEIAAAWSTYGGAYCVPLDIRRVFRWVDDRGKMHKGLASYMCKEIPSKPGQRQYQPSMGLIRPECIRQIVSDDYKLYIPPGAELLEAMPLCVNTYGSSIAQAYLNPVNAPEIKGDYRG